MGSDWRALFAEAAASALLAGLLVAAILSGQRNLLSENEIRPLFGLLLALFLVALFIVARGRIWANPALTFASALAKGSDPAGFTRLVLGQTFGACAGVVAAQAIFNLDPVQQSSISRMTAGLLGGEAAASFLLAACAIWFGFGWRFVFAGAAVLFAANWLGADFTTANPALTVARTLSSGSLALTLGDAAATAAVQTAGAGLGVAFFAVLGEGKRRETVRRRA